MQEKRFDPLELIKQILALLAVTLLTFAWTMTVLLIISFVALSYVTLKLDMMYVISAIVTVLVDAAYLIGKHRKKKKDGDRYGKNNTLH